MMKSGIHPTLAGVLLAFAVPSSGNDERNPLYKLQKALHVPVGCFIVPLFALANTGIALKEGWLSEMTTANSLGIIAGLMVGKPTGILLSCWAVTKLSPLRLPANTSWKAMTGVAILAGIGFTMSIFISNLAFADTNTVGHAKVAVLMASLLAAAVGLLILLNTNNTAAPSIDHRKT